MGKFIDLTGQRFGRLVIVSRAKNSKSGRIRWNCVCDCGGTTIASGINLQSGNTKSCGCLRKEMRTAHGMTRTSTYKTWGSMIQRCANPNNANYGGRGITVCERWKKFENFYEDMGKKPKGLSIERKDNSGNYCPKNCRWEAIKNQNRNKRSNVNIEYRGKTQCMSAWAEELGINYDALRYRLQTHPPQIAFNM